MTQTLPEIGIEETTGTGTAFPAAVILFNDDVHTFDEVIAQLVKAVRCTQRRAAAYAEEVHARGRARVYEGSMEECLRVAGVLEEIALRTSIEV